MDAAGRKWTRRFRAERWVAGGWLDENDLTPGPDHSLEGQVEQLARVHRALYDAGWMRYGWPERVGGLGGPPMLRTELGAALAGRDLTEPGLFSLIEVLAPTLIDFAPRDLAAEVVPRLLSGARAVVPGLLRAGIRAATWRRCATRRGDPRGDDWVVNGQKVWTSLAQYSRPLRAADPHRSPSATTGSPRSSSTWTPRASPCRPLRTMHGVDEFAEVFFDDVVVPADRMLGELGDGWRSRWTCSPTSAPRASGSASRTSTDDSTG